MPASVQFYVITGVEGPMQDTNSSLVVALSHSTEPGLLKTLVQIAGRH